MTSDIEMSLVALPLCNQNKIRFIAYRLAAQPAQICSFDITR